MTQSCRSGSGAARLPSIQQVPLNLIGPADWDAHERSSAQTWPFALDGAPKASTGNSPKTCLYTSSA